MVLVARWYARRIVNINVNVITAGMLAGVLTLIPVHLTRYVGIDGRWGITAVALTSDIIFDVAIYYLLHWVANHMPNRFRERWERRHPGRPKLSYFRDATLVQFERALLAPVYYGIFLSMMKIMLLQGMAREAASITALAAGILTTRVFHTLWMIRNERRAVRTLTRLGMDVPEQVVGAVAAEVGVEDRAKAG